MSSPVTKCPTTSWARWRPLFRSPVTPDHRALTDARATVHVLHALMERVGNLGVTIAGGADRVQLPGPAGDPPQAPPGVGAPARTRRLPLPRRARPRPVRRDARSTSRRGCAATSPRPRPERGWPRWSRSRETVRPIVCATPLEAARARAAAHRRARPAVQPAVALPASARGGSSSRSRRSRGCRWCAGSARRRHVHRPVRRRRAGGARGRRAPRGVPATPMRRASAAACRLPGARACLLADLGRCGAPCVGGQGVEEYGRIAAAARSARWPATRGRSSLPCSPPGRQPRGGAAVRGGGGGPRPAARLPARRRPGPAARAAGDGARARRGPAGGRRRVGARPGPARPARGHGE